MLNCTLSLNERSNVFLLLKKGMFIIACSQVCQTKLLLFKKIHFRIPCHSRLSHSHVWRNEFQNFQSARSEVRGQKFRYFRYNFDQSKNIWEKNLKSFKPPSLSNEKHFVQERENFIHPA